MRDCDGYDHIGMIDASGGVLDQDCEMFEHMTPHTLIKHEYLRDSAGAGRQRGGLGVETIYRVGSDATRALRRGLRVSPSPRLRVCCNPARALFAAKEVPGNGTRVS
ncbi:MAG: hydantoinase B/oxoprolinase family protein [Acidobacteriota bacterium]